MSKAKVADIQFLVFTDEEIDYINTILAIDPPSDKDEAYAGPQDVLIAYLVRQVADVSRDMGWVDVSEVSGSGVNYNREEEFEAAMVVYHSYLLVSAAYSFETDQFYSNKTRNTALNVVGFLTDCNIDLAHILACTHPFNFWADSRKYAWGGRKIQRHLNPRIMLTPSKPEKPFYEYNLNWIGVEGFNYLKSRLIGSDTADASPYILRCRHTDEAGDSLNGKKQSNGLNFCPLCGTQIPDDLVDVGELQKSIWYLFKAWNIIRTRGDLDPVMVNKIADALPVIESLVSMVPPSAVKRHDNALTPSGNSAPVSGNSTPGWLNMTTSGREYSENDLSKEMLVTIIGSLSYSIDHGFDVEKVFSGNHMAFTKSTKDLLVKIASDKRVYNADKVLETIQGYAKS